MSSRDAMVVDPACAGARRRPHLWPERSRLRLRRRRDFPHPGARAAARRGVGDEQPGAHDARRPLPSWPRHDANRFAGIKPFAEPAFAEQHLGEWQGQERKAFYAARKVGTHTLVVRARQRAPAGRRELRRPDAACRSHDRAPQQRAPGRDIVAVTHGGTIRAAIGFALGLEPQAALAFSVENCSLTRIDHLTAGGGDGLWRIVAVNHRPWSRTTAADHLAQTPIAIDKA